MIAKIHFARNKTGSKLQVPVEIENSTNEDNIHKSLSELDELSAQISNKLNSNPKESKWFLVKYEVKGKMYI